MCLTTATYRAPFTDLHTKVLGESDQPIKEELIRSYSVSNAVVMNDAFLFDTKCKTKHLTSSNCAPFADLRITMKQHGHVLRSVRCWCWLKKRELCREEHQCRRASVVVHDDRLQPKKQAVVETAETLALETLHDEE